MLLGCPLEGAGSDKWWRRRGRREGAKEIRSSREWWLELANKEAVKGKERNGFQMNVLPIIVCLDVSFFCL